MSRGRNARRGILATVVAVLAVVLVAFGALFVKANSAYEDSTRIDTAWCRTESSFKDSTPAAFATGTRDTGPFVDTTPYLMPDYSNVSFPSREGGVTIAAWWVPSTSAGVPAVVLVHGRGRCRGDPEVLLPAGMLHRHGFAVLVLDLRNHGGSTVTDGHHSFGVHETDVLGAWDWLRSTQSLPAERIGLYGVSLGAASAIMAMGAEARVAAVWEDSSFASVEATMPKELVRNHLPEFLAPVTVFAVRLFHESMRARCAPSPSSTGALSRSSTGPPTTRRTYRTSTSSRTPSGMGAGRSSRGSSRASSTSARRSSRRPSTSVVSLRSSHPRSGPRERLQHSDVETISHEFGHSWPPAATSTSALRTSTTSAGSPTSTSGPWHRTDRSRRSGRTTDAVEGLPAIEGTFWPVGPGHLVGGYDAGYYGYLWSLVYGDDLWSRFAAEGIDNPAVATAHRRDPGTGSDPGRGGTGGGVPGLAINGAGVLGPDGDRVHCD